MDIKLGGRTYEVTKIMGQQAVTREQAQYIPKERILDEIAVMLGRTLIKEGLVKVEEIRMVGMVTYSARGYVLKETFDVDNL